MCIRDSFKASETNEEEFDEYFEKAVFEVQCFMKMIEKNKQSRSFSISILERMLLSIVVEADRQLSLIHIYTEGEAQTDYFFRTTV